VLAKMKKLDSCYPGSGNFGSNYFLSFLEEWESERKIRVQRKKPSAGRQ
jgi:hypothetical protein